MLLKKILSFTLCCDIIQLLHDSVIKIPTEKNKDKIYPGQMTRSICNSQPLYALTLMSIVVTRHQRQTVSADFHAIRYRYMPHQGTQ